MTKNDSTPVSRPNEVEARILKNQYEIMWVLHYLMRKSAPDLVGRGGELDHFCDDLVQATKGTKALWERQ